MCARNVYSDVLVRHYKFPHNRGRLTRESVYETGFNPKCGDVIHLSILIGDDDIIEEVMFEGKGCMICLASASILTSQIKHMSMLEARKLINRVEGLFKAGSETSHLENLPDDIKALSSVRQFPTRVQCVTLAWLALHRALR